MNSKQWLSIGLVLLGVLTAGSAQLTDLLGPQAAKAIVSLAGLLNSALGGVLAIISTQSGLVKDVQAMPGVEKITVNAQANPTLAGLAVDPAQDKIEPAPGATAQVQAAAAQQ